VRVGLGDYPNYNGDGYGQNTAQFVERVRRVADEFGRPLASPAQAADLLGLRRP
jgi:3-keto-5-aminohexanoate cleavage enzyme